MPQGLWLVHTLAVLLATIFLLSCYGHILRRHGHGGEGDAGTSYFTIPWNEVVNKIKETHLTLDIIIPDTNNVNRCKYKRKYANEIGKHGCTGQPCFSILLVKDNLTNVIVTAYPVV